MWLMNNETFKTAHHNPPHLFLPDTLYMLTACIYQREPLLRSPKRKMEWAEIFLKSAEIHKWQVVAWIVLHSHYHAVVRSPENAATLSKFVGSYHKFTARKWNEEDHAAGQKVWWNYWDTCLQSEREYSTRLRYIFWNPVKHRLCYAPEEYRFSNYKESLTNWQPDFAAAGEVSDVLEP